MDETRKHTIKWYGQEKLCQDSSIWRHRSWAVDLRWDSGRGVASCPVLLPSMFRPLWITFWCLFPLPTKSLKFSSFPVLLTSFSFYLNTSHSNFSMLSLKKCEKVSLYIWLITKYKISKSEQCLSCNTKDMEPLLL